MIDREIADAACAETEGVLLSVDAAADAATGARVDRHLGHCQRCQQTRAQLEQLRDDVRAGAPALDDVRRARLLARLAPLADGLASRAAARSRSRVDRRGTLRDRLARRPWTAVTAVAVGCGALALLISGVSRRPALRPTPAPVAGVESAPRPTAVAAPQLPRPEPPRPAPVAAAPSLIKPYRLTGAGAKVVAAPLVGAQFQRLNTPAATVVRARLGDRTDATLVGPAEVSVLSAAQNVLDVQLQQGTLVVDFDHGGGGRLRIHSPGAVTEVVGTLLAVEVSGAESRISVSRGRVVVQPAEGPPHVVSAGESYTAGAPSAAVAMPAYTAALMARHDAGSGVKVATNRIRAAAQLQAPPAAPSSTVTERVDPAPVVPPPAAPASIIQAPPPVEAPPTPPRARPAPPSSTVALAPPPATVALAPPPRPRPAAVSTEDMYRAAEGAMGRRDWSAAEKALQQIIAARTGAPIEDVARYELAQLALRHGSLERAARWLDDLIASDREPALREPARFLRCDVYARAGQSAEARRCLELFRTRFPSSRRSVP